MQLPDYWLQRPAMNLDDEARAAFGRLLAQAQAAGPNALMRYTLARPKWQFFCYVADEHGIALHGTGNPDIEVFEPRAPLDLSAFGQQKAVFAAGDGLWAMFYAVVDRERQPMTLNNACIRLVDEAGEAGVARYVFSITEAALRQRPWRTGFVYLLPPGTFTSQPSQSFGPYEVRIPQLASPVPVTPLARLEVAPEDFPFLGEIRGHDEARLEEYARALQTGGPWPAGADL